MSHAHLGLKDLPICLRNISPNKDFLNKPKNFSNKKIIIQVFFGSAIQVLGLHCLM
jgi:hypothetical protein